MPQDAVREVGSATGLLTCNRHLDQPVDVPRDLPGVVILVHGVNDLGVSYQAFETGLCQGLNERLNRADLDPNKYRLPELEEPVVPDPDKIYYRLQKEQASKSPVIPFYWGYRAHADDVAKELVNGQIVDLHGNRLDRDFAKGGGMFANATTTIADMFRKGFTRKAVVGVVDTLAGADAHPLRSAPDRRYFVLAAKRLAALVEALRVVDPNETVTIIGHSQGCLVSLLAQAFLFENSKARRADCLILNNPPYGLQEPFAERIQFGDEQQTTEARVATLVNLVKLVTDEPHASPVLAELAHGCGCGRGRTGQAWVPSEGWRPGADGNFSELVHAFAERDNRGKVYLYFCPHDLTVGLTNVAGIGTFGVPDSIETPQGRTIPVRAQLGSGFRQRVWTWRSRDGAPVAIGAPGYAEHKLRLKGEPVHDGVSLQWVKYARVNVEAIRRIDGESLTPPHLPDLHHGELPRDPEALPAKGPRYQGKLAHDPIDAAVAVSNIRLRTMEEECEELHDVRVLPRREEYEAKVNQNTDPDHHTRIIRLWRNDYTARVWVERTETPAEARQRYQDKEKMDNTYHSAIVTNPEHHRWVTAMDVAIGQARALDDPEWRKVFVAIADWRTPFDEEEIGTLTRFAFLPETTRTLVEHTWIYYKTGQFPEKTLVPQVPPSQVVQQSIKDRSVRRATANTMAERDYS